MPIRVKVFIGTPFPTQLVSQQSSAGNDPDQYDHNGDHQQNMNESAHRMVGD